MAVKIISSGGSRGEARGACCPPPNSLFFRLTEARRAEKIFGGNQASLLSKGLYPALISMVRVIEGEFI